MSEDLRVIVALFGPIRLNTTGQLLKAVSVDYLNAVALASDHEESIKLGATLCVAVPKE